MKLDLNWKILLASLAIIGVITTSLGYIVSVSSVTMTTGIKVWSITKTNMVSTTSTSYVNVPGMKVTIDAPVGTNLVITFSAECGAVSGSSFIRVIVDGSRISPKDVLYCSAGESETCSFTWTTHVAKGIHTIKVKWLVHFSATGMMYDRSLVVLANSYKEFT
jgi:hypothetical protein